MSYFDLKALVEAYTGLERDALHIHAALFIYLAALLVVRKPGSLLPWLLVLVAELANEAHDLVYNWPDDPDWAVRSGIKDLWNTMLWPTAFLLAARWNAWRPRRRASADEGAVLDPEDEVAGEVAREAVGDHDDGEAVLR